MKQSLQYLGLAFILLTPIFSLAQTEAAKMEPAAIEKIAKDPLKVQAMLHPPEVAAGDHTTLFMQLQLPEGYHIYKESFRIEWLNPNNVKNTTPKIEPLVQFKDPVTKNIKLGVERQAQLSALLEMPTQLSVGEQNLQLRLHYQACTEKFCLLPRHVDLTVAVKIITFGENIKTTDMSTWLDFSRAIQKGTLFLFLAAFFAGLLTSFTPCIFPMIPITLAVIGSRTHGHSRTRSFFHSLSYVLGIAFTYSTLGFFAAKTGSLFGSFMSNPWVIIFVATMFVFMALSMFGLFEIQTPLWMQQKVGRRGHSKGLDGAFFAGLIAGIVASPCVGPVLISLLAFVSQNQNPLLGWGVLFSFSIGMGSIFLVLGTFTHLLQSIPKAGPWTVRIKQLFGVMMLAMAFYYVKPLLPNFLPKTTDTLTWQILDEAKLQEAKLQHKPAIIYFQAEWCGACHELKEKTFPDLLVHKNLENFALLTVDATVSNETVDRWTEKYNVIGLPTLIFFHANGEIDPSLTLTGFEDTNDFMQRLQKAQQ